MSKHTQVTSKETTWRNHLARHASSGKSVSAFCRDEAISEGNFYAWRSRLQTKNGNAPSCPPKRITPFIDLGAVKGVATTERLSGATSNSPAIASGIEVHIDLGGGVSLTIMRH